MAEKGISEQLMQALRFGGLEKAHLADLVKELDGIHQQGIGIRKVLTKGIPPVYDRVEAETLLNQEGLAKLMRVIETNARIQSVVIFPYGIPAVDGFRAEITVQ